MNGKSEHYELVEQFSRMAGQQVLKCPGEPSAATRVLRAKLILEEALETIAALGVTVWTHDPESVRTYRLTPEFISKYEADKPFDLEQVVDGCCDIKVVTTGTLVAIGVKDEEPQRVVDFNNLLKFGPGHTFRADGKLVKPPGHPAPDITTALENQKKEWNLFNLKAGFTS